MGNVEVQQGICDLNNVCPHCGSDMRNEHSHMRCPKCGYRDSCCF